MEMTPNNSAAYRAAHAAGWDAGNRSMRAAGRAQWNAEDWDAAARAFAELCDLLTAGR